MKLYNRKSDIENLKVQIEDLERKNRELQDKLSAKRNELYQYPEEIYALRSATDLEELGIGLLSLDNTFMRLSAIALRLFGLSPGKPEIPLKDFMDFISPDDKMFVQKTIEEIQVSGKLQHISYKIIRQDQDRDIRHLSSYIKAVETTDGNSSVLFTFTDVSRQDRAKRELLRAKERAEDTDKLKNIYLSNISREIRIPMNSIVGFAELLNIESITPQEKSEYVKIIKFQSNLLLKLIDDIAEIARFEAGEVKISKSPCNLNILLNELFSNFTQQKKIQKKDHIDLRLNIPGKKGIITYTDSGRLQQVLTNLISNALKFTEKGHIEFGYEVKDHLIEFYVRDTGIGLTKEEQKQVFDRFKYNEEIVTKKYEGTGLGLTIAKGIVRLLGGKVWIDSEPGKGTTIFFNLPLEEVPDENIEEVINEEFIKPDFSWKGKVILVVEDDDVNFKFIETILLENQAQVLRANNGLQAVELCRTINKIDLILMDIKMPLMDGFEATRQIKQINKSIPIIAQTAFALPEDRDKCLEAGCDEHITKPIDIGELIYKINKFFTP